jgi:hypothetical protein
VPKSVHHDIRGLAGTSLILAETSFVSKIIVGKQSIDEVAENAESFKAGLRVAHGGQQTEVARLVSLTFAIALVNSMIIDPLLWDGSCGLIMRIYVELVRGVADKVWDEVMRTAGWESDGLGKAVGI